MSQIRDTLVQINSIIVKLRADSIRAEVIKNVGISTGIKAASMVTGLLMQLVLVHLLGAKEFGNYTFVWAIFLSIAIIGKLGFELASIRFVGDYYVREEWSLLKGFLWGSRLIVAAVSFCVAGVSYLVIIQLLRFGILETEVVKIFAITLFLLPFFALTELNAGVLRGAKRLTESLFTMNVLFPALMSLLALLSTLFIDTITAQTIMKLAYVALVITLVTQFLLIRRALPSVTTQKPHYQNRKWVKVSSAMMFSSGTEQITRQLGTIVVGIIAGVTVSGIYAVAVRFGRLIKAGLQISNQSTAHMFTPLYVQGRKEELQKVVSMTALVTLATTMPFVLALFFWPDYILGLFGKTFAEQGPLILQILLLGQLVNSLTGPNGVLMQMTDYQNKMAWISGATLLFNVLLLIICVPGFGAVGVAIAASGAIIFRNVVVVIQVKRHLGINSTVFSRYAWRG